MNFIKKWSVGLLSMLPALAMAHPGHDHVHSGFMAGFIHPFTGLDHLIMALGFGVLLWSAAKQWKIAGVITLSITLVIGFLVGAQGSVPANIAEYGICCFFNYYSDCAMDKIKSDFTYRCRFTRKLSWDSSWC